MYCKTTIHILFRSDQIYSSAEKVHNVITEGLWLYILPVWKMLLKHDIMQNKNKQTKNKNIFHTELKGEPSVLEVTFIYHIIGKCH